jgi:hypothetical protein
MVGHLTSSVGEKVPTLLQVAFWSALYFTIDARYPISERVVTFNPTTRLYGFQFLFTGKPPHHQMEVFDSLNSVMPWVDPHHERVWEEAGDADETRLMVSTRYKPSSVMSRMIG